MPSSVDAKLWFMHHTVKVVAMVKFSSLLSWSCHLLTVWKALSSNFALERISKSKKLFAQCFFFFFFLAVDQRNVFSHHSLVTYLRRHVRSHVLWALLLFFPTPGNLSLTKDSTTAHTRPIYLLKSNYCMSMNAVIPLPSVLHWCLSLPNLLLSTACATASFSCCSDT